MIRTIALLLAATLLAACGKEPGPGSGDENSVENVTVKIVPDRTSFINNPLNGWVMYLGRSWDENFWTSQGYDTIKTSEGNTVNSPGLCQDRAEFCSPHNYAYGGVTGG